MFGMKQPQLTGAKYLPNSLHPYNTQVSTNKMGSLSQQVCAALPSKWSFGTTRNCRILRVHKDETQTRTSNLSFAMFQYMHHLPQKVKERVKGLDGRQIETSNSHYTTTVDTSVVSTARCVPPGPTGRNDRVQAVSPRRWRGGGLTKRGPCAGAEAHTFVSRPSRLLAAMGAVLPQDDEPQGVSNGETSSVVAARPRTAAKSSQFDSETARIAPLGTSLSTSTQNGGSSSLLDSSNVDAASLNSGFGGEEQAESPSLTNLSNGSARGSKDGECCGEGQRQGIDNNAANPNYGMGVTNGAVENGHAHHRQNGYGVAETEIPNTRPAAVVGLQPVALVDHVARVDWSLLEAVPGERGGSMRVTEEELDHILREVNSHFLVSSNGPPLEPGVKTLAGGSVANTIRGLAAGLGITTALVGVRGDDDRGQMFAENMSHAGVDLSRLRTVPGLTAQCACLVDAEGNRTMRPCFLNAVRLQAEELSREDFKGAKWLVLNGYGFYGTDLLEKAVELCNLEGVKVSMDLASFEVVRNFRPQLMKLLESRKVDLVFANEDEARELIKGEEDPCPETCLSFLSKYCETAVVMLGSKGCIARYGKQTVRVPAIRGTRAVDTTGAGDLFASGFLYGVLNNASLEDCCKLGCCTGGAVVRGLGGEVGAEGWEWMHQQLQASNLPPINRVPRHS